MKKGIYLALGIGAAAAAGLLAAGCSGGSSSGSYGGSGLTLLRPTVGEVVRSPVSIAWTGTTSAVQVAVSQLGDDRYDVIANATQGNTLTWDANVPDGDYDIRLMAAGSRINSGAISLDNTAPTVSISKPAAGDVLSGRVVVNWQTQDVHPATVSVRLEGAGARVDLATDMGDGGAFAFDTAQITQGSYTLSVVATDEAGNQGAATVAQLQVVSGVLPTAQGSTTAGATPGTTGAAASPPVSEVIRILDTDQDGEIGAGDELVIDIDELVEDDLPIVSDLIERLQLPIVGDILGDDFEVRLDPAGTALSITLGDAAQLEVDADVGATDSLDVAGVLGGLLDPILDVDEVDLSTLGDILSTASPGLLPGVTLDIAADATSVAAGDIDVDGDIDLVVGRGQGQHDLILLQTDAGVFVDSGLRLSLDATTSIGLADLDLDGDLDIVSIAEDAIDRVFETVTGSDGILDVVEVDVDLGFDGVDLALIDVDLNGKLDIVICRDGHGDGPSVFLNVAAEVGEIELSATADVIIGQALLAHDLDVDGDIDLAVGRAAGLLDVTLENDGEGRFGVEAELDASLGDTQALAMIDVDLDGDLDLVTAGPDGICVHVRVGADLLEGEPLSLDAVTALAVGDLDLDGKLELAACALGVLDVAVDVELIDPLAPAGDALMIDIDLDGDLDLVAATVDGVLVRLGSGNAVHAAGLLDELTSVIDTARTGTLSLGDIDLDGDLDLIRGTLDPLLDTGAVFGNDGHGVFQQVASLPASLGATLDQVLGDIDLDGDLDLVEALGLGGATRILVNDGEGHFSLHAGVAGLASVCVELCDIDLDGDLDLIEAGVLGTIRVFLNDGDGHFSLDANVDVDVHVNDLICVDIDLDGDLDLIAACDGENVIYVNVDGILEARVTFDGSLTEAIAAIDVDVDGDLDLICGNGAGAKAKVWINDGDGGFDVSVDLDVEATTALACLDVDVDGDLDVVFGTADGHCKIAINDGHGAFAVAEIEIDADIEALVAGDIDIDGDVDLVLCRGGLLEGIVRAVTNH